MVRTFSTGNKKPCKPKDNTKKGSHGSKNQIIRIHVSKNCDLF